MVESKFAVLLVLIFLSALTSVAMVIFREHFWKRFLFNQTKPVSRKKMERDIIFFFLMILFFLIYAMYFR